MAPCKATAAPCAPAARSRTPRRRSPAWLAAGLLLAIACGEERSSAPLVPPAPPPEPVPLPGCEGLDYSRCDVRLPECVDNLVQIASCAMGGSAEGPSPNVAFLSQEEAEQNLLEALMTQPPPSPDHFQQALVLLGLTQPRSFEPEVTAQRLAQSYAAYYRRDSGELMIIDRGGALGATGAGTPAVQALVVHELIHALQDSEHDLDGFALAHQQDSDGNMRGNCLIEGEARLHELRLYSALWGVDVSTVDWPSDLRRRRNEGEDEVFLATDLYAASLLNVPYAYGTEFVERVWSEQGEAGVRALFASPPSTVREILAAAWGDTESPEVEAPAPLAPEGLTRAAYSSLGAWGVYLLARPRATSIEAARQLALSWRGDLLEAYAYGDRQTAVSWTLLLANEADAATLTTMLTTQAVPAERSGRRIRLLRANGELPAALVAANAAQAP